MIKVADEIGCFVLMHKCKIDYSLTALRIGFSHPSDFCSMTASESLDACEEKGSTFQKMGAYCQGQNIHKEMETSCLLLRENAKENLQLG